MKKTDEVSSWTEILEDDMSVIARAMPEAGPELYGQREADPSALPNAENDGLLADNNRR